MAKRYKTDLDMLCSSMQSARQTLRYAREERQEAVRQYCGTHWAEQATRERIPINLISLYISIVSRKLIAKAPRCMISTFKKEMKPTISAMQDWVNQETERINLTETLQRVVLDALFSVGICKVALATPADANMFGWNLQAGEPYACPIDLDDFVYDIHARSFDEASFIGHRFRVPLAAVKDSKIYSKVRKDLTESEDARYNQEGDEKISALGRGNTGNDDEIEPMIDLWEVYKPRERCIITLAEGCLTGAMSPGRGGEPEPLREQDWIGHDRGPYSFLGYGTVPGNAMPKAPIMDLIDLHVAANQMMRKLMWGALNLKEVLIVPKGQPEDLERIRTSSHGELLPLDRPDDHKQLVMNGPNQVLFQFFMQVKDLFSWLAGNLDILGGLSPQSKTATQDSMLDKNSTQGIADMQDRTVNFTADVMQRMCWYWYKHPTKTMNTNYSPKGLPDIAIQRQVQPWNHPDPTALRRSGNWEDLGIKIDPYSMQHSTPQQRAKDLMQLVQTLYAPMSEAAARQGVALDFNKLFEKLAGYMDMPDLGEILTMQKPPDEEAQEGNADPEMQQPGGETTHVRMNMPGRTRQGNDLNLMNQLSGVDGGGASNGQMNGAM